MNASNFGVKRSKSQHDREPSSQRHIEIDAVHQLVVSG